VAKESLFSGLNNLGVFSLLAPELNTCFGFREPELTDNEDALFSLLVFTGYLKAEKHSRGPLSRPAHFLSIPNREVNEVYTTTFRRWMDARMRGHGGSLDDLCKALLSGDAEPLEEQLQAFVTNLLSYHDPGTIKPERVDQGFVVGKARSAKRAVAPKRRK
jgi:hypothetical protein